MSTDTKIAVDRPIMTGPAPKPPRDRDMRIATISKQLLDEVHAQPLDTASLDRLRTIDTQIIHQLLTELTPNLREELQRLALPLTRHTGPSDAELCLVHAQLVGWLQGLIRTHADRPNIEPCSLTTRLPDDSAPNKDNPVIRSARQTLITAITKRITQQHLNAAQAAVVLHLTGPRVTQLLQGNIDEFTLDQLVNLLPFLQCTVHVVPAPEQRVRSSG